MDSIRELHAKRDEVVTQLDALEAAVGDGSFTNEQRSEYDALTERVETINADLARVTRRREAERAEIKTARASGALTSGRWLDEDDDDKDPVLKPGAQAPPIVYRGLEHYGLSDDQRLKAAFGQQLVDCYNVATGRGMSQELAQIDAAAQGAGEKIGSDGGFLVQTDVGGLLQQVVMTDSELISRVRNVPLGPNSNGITFRANAQTSRAAGSRWGGVQGYWVDEGTAPTATNPTWRKVELKLNKVAALGYATDELRQDVVALGNIMFDAFADELRFLVQDAIINGTGTGQPLGILNAPATVSQAKQGSQTATTVVSENLSKMWARLHSRSKRNAVWLINTDVNPELDNLYITGASSDFNPRFVSYDATGATRIKGREVIETEYNATLGTVGDILVVDLSQYLFASKLMQMADSMHVRFTTDEQAFRVTWRVDGRPAWISALTPFKGSNTQSPFVSLATRA